MHLFDKPKERNVTNAVLCYLLCIVLLVVFMFLCGTLFSPPPPGGKPIDIPIFLAGMLSYVYCAVRLLEQAKLWRHPKAPCLRQYKQ